MWLVCYKLSSAQGCMGANITYCILGRSGSFKGQFRDERWEGLDDREKIKRYLYKSLAQLPIQQHCNHAYHANCNTPDTIYCFKLGTGSYLEVLKMIYPTVIPIREVDHHITVGDSFKNPRRSPSPSTPSPG